MTTPTAGLPNRLRGIGAGPDGIALVGVDAGDRPVLVHRLRPEVSTDPARRRRLERRLAFEQAAAASETPGFERLRAVDLVRTPAIIVVDSSPQVTLASLLPELRAAPDRGLLILARLASTLALCHAEGIAHGGLSPWSVGLLDDDTVRLSILGLQTGAVPPADPRWLHQFGGGEPSIADDARAFGGLCALVACADDDAYAWMGDAETSDRRRTSPRLALLLDVARDLLDLEPAWRPGMADVAERLRGLHALLVGVPGGGADQAPATPRPPRDDAAGTSPTVGMPTRPPLVESASTHVMEGHADVPSDVDTLPVRRRRIGRFLLLEPIGAGAMGQVWRATDDDTGDTVAVKLIGKGVAPTQKARQRFQKEARLLSELRHPGIARFLAAGELADTLYLVTELVEGASLKDVVRDRGPWAEHDAIAAIADLTRALIDVHDNGIVHRDIKPDNIMMVEGAGRHGTRVKLIDFGVARHLDEAGSLAMTREGAVLGTPLYMSPEQALGEAVDARSDLYAVGVTLFEMLVGEAPFAGRGIAQVLAMQIEHVPPRVNDLRPDASSEVAAVVARCLEKKPGDRYADARALLADLLPLIGQAPASTGQAPPNPAVRRYAFTFSLSSSPAALWPFVSNTERVNKAIGVAVVEESVAVVDDDVTRLGRSKQVGFAMAWREHPYEWVFERRLGVLREYDEGPLRWLRSTIELIPDGTGTRLVQTIEVEPRGLVGKAAAAIEIGLRTRRGLEKAYERIDALLGGRLGAAVGLDAFEATATLAPDVDARLSRLEQQAVKQGASAKAIDAIGSFVRLASTQELARLRPIALARRFSLPEGSFVDACYHAASVGILRPLWDLLCPSCRVPSSIEETLKALRTHGRCEVCNLEFSLDLASSIELIFQVHPSLRTADAATYCISSPAHTPHVLAQLRVPVGERAVLDVGLPEGHYQLASRTARWTMPFRVRAGAPLSRWDVALGDGRLPPLARELPSGRQELVVHNDLDRAHLVRVERVTPRDDVLTASRALSSSLFKRLFPGEVLAEGALVRVAAVTMLIVEPGHRGGRLAIEDLYGLYRAIDETVASHAGSVVRLHGDGVLAVFDNPAAAVRAAMAIGQSPTGAGLRAAVHRASAGAVTLNERLDYFGACVSEVIELVARARPGELLVSDAIVSDPDVQAALGSSDGVEATFDDVGQRRRLGRTSPTFRLPPETSALT